MLTKALTLHAKVSGGHTNRIDSLIEIYMWVICEV